MKDHGDVAAAYLDGLLSADEESAFLTHLVECQVCEAALADEIQLRDREPPSEPMPVSSRPAADEVTSWPVAARCAGSWKHRLIQGACAVVAVAAAWLLFFHHPGTEDSPPIPMPGFPKIADGPRHLEARLSYPPLSGFRPYDVEMGSTSRNEAIPLHVVAELNGKDCHGAAIVYFQNGALDAAESQFKKCKPEPGIDADRAAVALKRQDFAKALELSQGVLADHPDHQAALWNHALALRGLSLYLTAAEEFDRIAAKGEAGWADEARNHARFLRQQVLPESKTWKDVVARGNGMVTGGPPISPELARRHPARSRMLLEHAIRAARTGARLDALRGLAGALDPMTGGGLAAQLERARARLRRPARVALLDEYAAFVTRGAPDQRAFRRWLARARAAGADDLIVAAGLATGRLGGSIEEALAVAAREGDRWMEVDVIAARAASEKAAGHLDTAAALLERGERKCATEPRPYGCLRLALERAALELILYRPPDAAKAAMEAFDQARKLHEWVDRRDALYWMADAERFRRNTALATAFYREYALVSGSCEAARQVDGLLGELLFDEHRFAEARELAVKRPTCGGPPWPPELIGEVDLLRAGFPARDRAALLKQLDEARAAAPPGSDRSLLYDYLGARASIGSDPGAIDRLAAVVRAARAHTGDGDGERVAPAAEMAWIVAAGERRAWRAVVAIAADVRGVPAPTRCALALGADDFRMAAVALGPHGEVEGSFAPDVTPSMDWTAPAPLRARLDGCEVVDVLALTPWLGVGPLLEPGKAWRYIVGPPRPADPGPGRKLIVASPTPPDSLKLDPLPIWPELDPGAELLTGEAATPEQFAAAASSATMIEIHAHAIRVPQSDAPAIALSASSVADGSALLTAERVREMRLPRAPVVLLDDCGAAVPAHYAHTSWGLPAAFRMAGARSVVASLVEIPAREAKAFFARVRADIEGGMSVPAAVARARAEKISSDPSSWVRHVVVFE